MQRIIAKDLFPSSNSQCPCRSNKKSKKCCQIRKRVFFRKPIDTRQTNLDKTNYAHKSCIGSFTNDCSQKMSGEHYFSKAVLELINKSQLKISGWPHNETGEKEISINSLVVNCLCTRHNSQLSPLDNVASDLFESLIRFMSTPAPSKEYSLFNFWDIERWMIKTLVMAGEAGLLRMDNIKQIVPPDLKQLYLDILFMNAPLSFPGGGLYFMYDVNTPIKFNREFMFNSNSSNKNTEVEGCTINLCGFKFVFSHKKLSKIEAKVINDDSYRPWRFVISNGVEKNVIDFSAKDKRNITFEIDVKNPIKLKPEEIYE